MGKTALFSMRPSSAKWPFASGDEITESACTNVCLRSGKRLSRILREARQIGTGPKFSEDTYAKARMYQWDDVAVWLGDEVQYLYYKPDNAIYPYRTEDPQTKELRRLYDAEKARADRLAELLAISGRPHQESHLPSHDTLVALSIPYATVTGIYFLIQDDQIVYVGQALDMSARIAQHAGENIKQFNRVLLLPTPKAELNVVEASYIQHLAPMYNSLNTKLPSYKDDIDGIRGAQLA